MNASGGDKTTRDKTTRDKTTRDESSKESSAENAARRSASQRVLNVPNSITLARLALSVVVFVLIGLQQPLAALVVFVLAASTDWVDGYWARKYGQVTKLGRILDPFVDKVIICGTFVYLAAAPESGVAPWMAVLVLARELLVTVLRSLIEQGGGDFSANWPAKWKMALQCVAVALSLLSLSYAEPARGLTLTRDLSIWLAMISTVYSGAIYFAGAWKTLVT